MANGSDICLVIEGSYPYVTGGVSSWIQWLLENMQDHTFSIVALTADRKTEQERKYVFPENVVSFQDFVIFDYSEIEGASPLKLRKKEWLRLSARLHRLMKDWQKGWLSPESIRFLKELLTGKSPRIFRNFLDDESAFGLLTRLYEEFRADAGFVKYFYNTRNIHLILFRLISLVTQLPPAAVYHSPGTGYGGLLACLRAALFAAGSMITEHGIYLQEREMELLKSEWLDDPYLKDMWIDNFTALCKWQYNTCDRLITLYEGNKQLEIDYGSRADKIQVIPNGIKIERFQKARQERCRRHPRTIGFVGRVDSVKDIKTFIQALAVIRRDYTRIRGLIIGPRKDQPGYYRECVDLIAMFNLTGVITFTGRTDVLKYYREMDVLLLTSIKEAMPLAVMEAMACGIPVVATDVGACRELIFGLGDGLGDSGFVTRVRDPEGIAEAALRILRDPGLADRMAEAGMNRIERFYREELIINQYQEIYRELLNGRHHLSA